MTFIRFIGLLTILYTSALFATQDCQVDLLAKQALINDKTLKSIYDKHYELFASDKLSYCDFVAEFKQPFIELVKVTEKRDFASLCDAKYKVALGFIDHINRYFERECLDIDCRYIEEQLSKEPWVRKIGNVFYLYNQQESIDKHILKGTNQSFKAYSIQRDHPFYECGTLKVGLLSFDDLQDDSQAKLNQIMQTNVPVVLTEINNKTKTVDSAYQQLKSDLQTDFLHYELVQNPTFNTYGVFAFETKVFSDTGGANPSDKQYHTVIDMGNHKQLTLEDIFNVEDREKILEIGKKALAKWAADNNFNDLILAKENVPEASKDWSDANGFYLPNNFSVSDEGVTFVYNQYDIAPRSAGTIKILLSFRDIDGYLKRGSAVDMLLNE